MPTTHEAVAYRKADIAEAAPVVHFNMRLQKLHGPEWSSAGLIAH